MLQPLGEHARGLSHQPGLNHTLNLLRAGVVLQADVQAARRGLGVRRAGSGRGVGSGRLQLGTNAGKVACRIDHDTHLATQVGQQSAVLPDDAGGGQLIVACADLVQFPENPG